MCGLQGPQQCTNSGLPLSLVLQTALSRSGLYTLGPETEIPYILGVLGLADRAVEAFTKPRRALPIVAVNNQNLLRSSQILTST